MIWAVEIETGAKSMAICDLCGKVADCVGKEIEGQELSVCEDCPVMDFTAEQIQMASLIDSRVQALSGSGCDDTTIRREMVSYDLPGFRRLWNTSQRGEIEELCRRLPWF